MEENQINENSMNSEENSSEKKDNKFNLDKQSTQETFNPYTAGSSINKPSNPFINNAPANDYLILNIIASIVGLVSCGFCCISSFIGIVGIVFSAKTRSANNLGDFYEANKNSKVAKILMIVSLALTGLVVLYLLFCIIFSFALPLTPSFIDDLGGYY